MCGGGMGNCSTMSVVENFFEKFEKGELREAEAEVSGMSTSSGGELVVSVDKLVTVEDVVSVLVKNADGNYQPVDPDGNTNDIASAEAFIDESNLDDTADGDLEDNQVGLQFYNATDLTAIGAETALPDVKVVARGY